MKSILGGKNFAFTDAFDHGYTLKFDLERILRRKVPLLMYTDSDSLFKIIVRNSMITERTLMIDPETTCEAYSRNEISDIGWIRSNDNPGMDSQNRRNARRSCSLWTLGELI